MEPAAIVDITSGCMTIAKNLMDGVLAVKDLWRGIRDVDESTEAFATELEAFHFALSIVKRQISRTESFSGGVKSNYLDKISKAISKDRSSMQQFRSYWRTCRTKQEISHLRLRLQTYTATLNIPILIMNTHGVSHSQVGPNPASLDSLAHTITKLDGTIAALAEQVQSLFLDQSSRGAVPATEALEYYEDSEDLIDIAQDLRSKASSISSDSEDRRSVIFTVSDSKAAESENSSVDTGEDYGQRGVTDWLQGHEDSQDQSQPGIQIPRPPSDVDPEARVILERYRFGKELITQEKYDEAECHLRRTWETMKDYDKQISCRNDSSTLQDPSLQLFAKREVQTEIQLYLAHSLIGRIYKRSSKLAKDYSTRYITGYSTVTQEPQTLLQDVLKAKLSSEEECELAANLLVKLTEASTRYNMKILEEKLLQGKRLLPIPECDFRLPWVISVLAQVLDHPDVSDSIKGYAFHILALTTFCDQLEIRPIRGNNSNYASSGVQYESTPKSLCIKAVRLRKHALGWGHKKHKESLTFLIYICVEEQDSDLRFWLDELPPETTIDDMKLLKSLASARGRIIAFPSKETLDISNSRLDPSQREQLKQFYANLHPLAPQQSDETPTSPVPQRRGGNRLFRTTQQCDETPTSPVPQPLNQERPVPGKLHTKYKKGGRFKARLRLGI